MRCPTCDRELIQKNRILLFLVGMAMLASMVASFVSAWILFPAAFLVLIGVYLMLWGTRGKGLWCRTCKRAPLL